MHCRKAFAGCGSALCGSLAPFTDDRSPRAAKGPYEPFMPTAPEDRYSDPQESAVPNTATKETFYANPRRQHDQVSEDRGPDNRQKARDAFLVKEEEGGHAHAATQWPPKRQAAASRSGSTRNTRAPKPEATAKCFCWRISSRAAASSFFTTSSFAADGISGWPAAALRVLDGDR